MNLSPWSRSRRDFLFTEIWKTPQAWQGSCREPVSSKDHSEQREWTLYLLLKGNHWAPSIASQTRTKRLRVHSEWKCVSVTDLWLFVLWRGVKPEVFRKTSLISLQLSRWDVFPLATLCYPLLKNTIPFLCSSTCEIQTSRMWLRRSLINADWHSTATAAQHFLLQGVVNLFPVLHQLNTKQTRKGSWVPARLAEKASSPSTPVHLDLYYTQNF